MADWKVYAKAARNTARRQAPDLAGQARDSARTSTRRAAGYARAAGRAAEQGTRDSRKNVRRDAAAYALVTGRSLQRAQIGKRLLHALRDAALMGASLLVIWFVVTRTGVQIPITVVLAIVLVLMVVRFGYALIGRPEPAEDEFEDEDDAEMDGQEGGSRARSAEERDDRTPSPEREYDPREERHVEQAAPRTARRERTRRR